MTTMMNSKFQDDQGNEIQFIRKDVGEDVEVTFITHDIAGKFISHTHSFYSSNKLQELSYFSESGDLISRHVMEYCSDAWDAWHREFDADGKLLEKTFLTWDKTYQGKAE